jgi:hypothetical protein
MSWSELKMRHPKFLFFTILAALVCAAAGQTTAALRIVSPRSGDQIDTDTVTIRYVLAPEVSANEVPAFNLLLDDGDPVQTNDSEYTFGVMPGEHTVIVQVVDANGTPIVGAQDRVQFTVLPPQNKR